MEYLINIGIAILCALGVFVLLIIVWFVIGIYFAMRDLFFKKRSERKFISHSELMQSMKNKQEFHKCQNECPHENYAYTDSHPDKPFTCKDCGKLI